MRYLIHSSKIHVPSTIIFLIIITLLSILLLNSCGKQEPNIQPQQTEISDTPTIYTVINKGFYNKCVVSVVTLRYHALYRLRTISCPQSFDENREFEVSYNKLQTLIN